MKILIVPHDAGNVAPLLARRFRAMGHDARCIIFAQSYLGYRVEPPDIVLGGRGVKRLLLLELKRWWVLYWALKHDAIIFTYGSTILPNPIFIGWGLTGFKPKLRLYYSILTFLFSYSMLDVRLLKFLGKKIVVLFQGGDGRRGDILRERGYPDIDEEPPGYYHPWIDKLKARRAKIWAKYADKVYYHNPDLAWGLSGNMELLCYPVEIKVEQ